MKTFSERSLFAFACMTLVFALACGGGGSTSGGGTPAPPPTPTAATPAFSPAAGNYAQAQTVTISDTTPAAAVYYTTDGSTPTTASTKYGAAVTVASTTTIKAMATAAGYLNSAVASASYTIASQSAPSYTWNNVEIIAGGFITGITFHSAQEGLIYARTDIGGAYRWDAAAHRWIPLNDSIGFANWNYLGIEAIGLDPSDAQRLYLAAGTYTSPWVGNGAILVSTDQGRNFQTVPMPFQIGGNEDGRSAGDRLAVDPAANNVVYFGSRKSGLWKSVDYGATWHQVTSFPVTGGTNGAGIVFVDFVKKSGSTGFDTPVIYVGVSDTGTHLYRSTDAGQTWAVVPGQPSNQGLYPNHGVFGPDGNLYISYGDTIGPMDMKAGAIYKYTPESGNPGGNGAWMNITPPQPDWYEGGFGAIAVDAKRPGTVMVSTMDLWWPGDDFYRSTDAGATWTSVRNTHPVFDNSISPWISDIQSSSSLGWWMGALAIDPFDSDHVLYGTGATIWASTDASKADSGGASHWGVGALGIEETAVTQLISPPAGAHLISGLGDINGFVHNDVTVTPPAGIVKPAVTTCTGLDFAQNKPAVMARVGSNGNATPFGAYSTDGGTTWTGFASHPTTVDGGSIAVSADGSTFVWSMGEGAVAYSTNNGGSWTSSSGAPAKKPVFADRVNVRKFYILDGSGKALYESTDRGISFTPVQQAMQSDGNSKLSVSPSAEGDLWLSTGTGLFHSTDSGVSFARLSSVQEAYALGFGKAATDATYPTMYLAGKVNGAQAIFRSTDQGVSWIRINDDQHQYGWISIVTGDPRIFGRVYLGSNGRGIIYGDSAE